MMLCRATQEGTTSCVSLEGNAVMLAHSPEWTMGEGLSLVLLAYLGGLSIAVVRRIFLGK